MLHTAITRTETFNANVPFQQELGFQCPVGFDIIISPDNVRNLIRHHTTRVFKKLSRIDVFDVDDGTCENEIFESRLNFLPDEGSCEQRDYSHRRASLQPVMSESWDVGQIATPTMIYRRVVSHFTSTALTHTALYSCPYWSICTACSTVFATDLRYRPDSRETYARQYHREGGLKTEKDIEQIKQLF